MRLRHTSHSGALSLCLGNSLHTSSQEEPGLLKAALIEGVAHSSQIVVHLVLSSPSTFFLLQAPHLARLRQLMFVSCLHLKPYIRDSLDFIKNWVSLPIDVTLCLGEKFVFSLPQRSWTWGLTSHTQSSKKLRFALIIF